MKRSLEVAAAVASCGLLLAESNPPPGDDALFTSAAGKTEAVSLEELITLRDSFDQTPHLPVPDEWTEEIFKRPEAKAVKVIKPQELERHFGINFFYQTIREVSPGSFAMVPHPGVEIFVRADNPELLKSVFGFLRPDPKTLSESQMYIAHSLDIAIIQGPRLCSQDDVSYGNAFLRDYADWVYQGLEKFKETLVRYRKHLTLSGLPPVSLPNGETVPPLLAHGLHVPYLAFGGDDIIDIASQLTVFERYFNLHEPPDSVMLVPKADCEASVRATARTVGPIPEFVMDELGRIATDKNGRPLVRLKSRIYCALDTEILRHPLAVGELLTHEISHVERRLLPHEVPPQGQPDEHITSNELGYGTLSTRKSEAYVKNAKAKLETGDDAGLLFLVKTQDQDLLTELSVNPANLLLGFAALEASRFFAERMGPPQGDKIDRARFLSTGLGAIGLSLLGVK